MINTVIFWGLFGLGGVALLTRIGYEIVNFVSEMKAERLREKFLYTYDVFYNR